MRRLISLVSVLLIVVGCAGAAASPSPSASTVGFALRAWITQALPPVGAFGSAGPSMAIDQGRLIAAGPRARHLPGPAPPEPPAAPDQPGRNRRDRRRRASGRPPRRPDRLHRQPAAGLADRPPPLRDRRCRARGPRRSQPRDHVHPSAVHRTSGHTGGVRSVLDAGPRPVVPDRRRARRRDAIHARPCRGPAERARSRRSPSAVVRPLAARRSDGEVRRRVARHTTGAMRRHRRAPILLPR